ncbi:U-box domain-containing protein 15 [Hordeum vulgare]|nr:U-box domain-containing protein 15 [Hordeum vulgare]
MPQPVLPPSSAATADPEPSRAGAREMDDEDLVEELLATVNSARAYSEFRRTQRKECHNLLRWLQLILPLLEELRDSAPHLTDDAYRRLTLLGRALAAARRLLRSCNDGSKIFLALESEAVLGRFRTVYEKMNSALDGMPYAELGISDEVTEQVELMNAQLMRCKKRTDTQDIELSMDLMVILQNNKDEERNADRAILDRLASKLELQMLADLRAETVAIKKLINERNGQHADSTKQIVELLHKFKAIAGIEEKNVLGSETYERRSIQKWLDSGERTCPKTRQPLVHLSLAPNYALKNLILQWCDKHKVELQRREPEPVAEQDGHPREDIPSLVEALSSIHPDVQRKAAKKIRMLSKESPENRALIVGNGGIPALIGLLAYPDKKVQENTVTSLLNLSIDHSNKLLITKGGAIPLIIEILRNGSAEGQENSAATLFSLSMLDENKATIGTLGGITPLVELLTNGTVRGKKDAATAIFNLILNQQNKVRATQAGIVPSLMKVMDDRSLGMVDEALSIFLLLSSHPTSVGEIGTTPFVEKLVQLIKEGTPKNKECALSVLLELGSKKQTLLVHALRFGLHEHLSQIAKTGTSRAQRKANSLIQIAKKCY